MTRKLTLSLILTVSALLVGRFCFAATIIDNGTNTNYSLTSADSLVINAGTYTGNINSFPSGARITVIATFQPASMPNNAAGTMYVFGTAIITQTTFRTNTSFTLINYGILTVDANVVINGNNQTWTNNYGGIINFAGDVLMNGNTGDVNNILINYQTVNCNGNFQMNSGSSFINYKNFSEIGNFRVNGGTLINEGNLDITGNILMNNGASVIRNYCRFQATAGINNTSGNFYNYSYVWAKNSDITNSANIINSSVANGSVYAITTPMIHGRNYTHSNSGTMTGPCLLYFYGTTTMTGGTMGVAGPTADTIKMYDVTRTTPPNIFDVQSGGIRNPNVIYNAWGVPDSTRNYLLGCSIEVIMETPLPIKWNYFFVSLSDKIPVLTWSAEFDRGTVFIIQRSYDGRNFSAIKDMPAEAGKSEYEYSDRLVNKQEPIVYYRIKAIDLNGVEKYTRIRIVTFNNQPAVSIYVTPNPFKSNFIINFLAAQNEMITIRLFNANGQQQLAKNIMVNNGMNSITVSEAAQLASGIYFIQVTNGREIISSGKIMKQ